MVVHELGHALHALIDHDLEVEPVTEYGMVNKYEAFADAFTFWVWPQYQEFYPILRQIDEHTQSFFEHL